MMRLFAGTIALGFLCWATACNNNQPDRNTASKSQGTDSGRKNTVPEKKEPVPEQKEVAIKYSFIKKKDWQSQKDSFEGAKHLDLLIAINRVDSSTIKRLDSIMVPNRYDLPLNAYMPFPETAEVLKPVKKVLIFSNLHQAFAAYEYGKLVIQGQTNTGTKANPTPPKLYYCNWKAKRSISTVNSSWILNWNFNVSNFGGIGFHQYALPGYPASHSCMRLQRSDAFFLYNWAEQWIMQNDQVVANGTPVLLYGEYPFGQPRPWFALIEDPKAMTITQEMLDDMFKAYLPEILEKQKQREALGAAKTPEQTEQT
ncbi:MAG: murein L,D-transpeptidase [Sphingobacteriales bacterium]|nr:MAG: murein L,D-transpeptidase [Sphingobacteriales bacterium]